MHWVFTVIVIRIEFLSDINCSKRFIDVKVWVIGYGFQRNLFFFDRLKDWHWRHAIRLIHYVRCVDSDLIIKVNLLNYSRLRNLNFEFMKWLTCLLCHFYYHEVFFLITPFLMFWFFLFSLKCTVTLMIHTRQKSIRLVWI